MRKGIKVVLFTGLGILVTGVIICAIVFAVHGFNWKSLIRPKAQEASIHLEQITKTIDEDFNNLEVDVASAEVYIQKSTDGTCRIEYMDDPDHEQYEILVKDGRLIFKNIQTSWDWDSAKDILDHVFDQVGSGFNMEEKKVTIFLPEKAYQTLSIASASGDVRIQEALTFTNAAVATASGEVSIGNMQGLDTLAVATASGSVILSNMTIAQNTSINTASGDVHLDEINIGEEMEITTTSGQVTLKRVICAEGEIHTASGDVKLENLETDSMSIETASGDVTGMISEEYNVSAHSASGDIRVPSGSKGEWKIGTASGDILLQN